MKNKQEEEIRRQVSEGGNEQVLTFIFDILFQSGEKGFETTRRLFASGYCYYFARMLEDAFPGGQVCIAYPFGHIVYIYEGVAYDADGISIAEYNRMFIPVSFLGDALDDFRHIDGKVHGTTQEELVEIRKRWEELGTPIKAFSRQRRKNLDKKKYHTDRTLYLGELQRQQRNVNLGHISTEQAQAYLDVFCIRNGIEKENVQDIERKISSGKEETNESLYIQGQKDLIRDIKGSVAPCADCPSCVNGGCLSHADRNQCETRNVTQFSEMSYLEIHAWLDKFI